MKKTAIFSFVLAALMLSGCGSSDSSSAETTTTAAPAESKQEQTEADTTTTTAAPEESAAEEQPDDGSVKVDFSAAAPDTFEASNGWTNGDPFNVFWRDSNVLMKDGQMVLTIDKDPDPQQDIPYSGAEYRSKDFYGYGRYEVSMKAIKNDGVVSSFFTYTGPSDNNPWDEIDIEVLGKDTTKVQFNYFTDGKGEHEFMYDLGFDASEDYHTYAFEWHKDKIVWFVDGKEAHTAEESIPVTPGKIMMNAWCGKGVDSWLKAFDDSNLPLSAEYKTISFTPFDE